MLQLWHVVTRLRVKSGQIKVAEGLSGDGSDLIFANAEFSRSSEATICSEFKE